MQKKIVVLLAAAGTVLLAGFGAYTFKAMDYGGKFLPNTFLNEDNVGGMSVEQAKRNLQEMGSNGAVTLIKKDGSKEEIPLAELSYSTEYAQDIAELQRKQNRFAWLLTAFGDDRYNVEVSTSYDRSRLAEKVKKLRCISGEGIEPPKDARVEKTDDGWQIVDAIEGNKLDNKKVVDAIGLALDEGKMEVDLNNEGCYLKAAVKADDPKLKAQLENIKKYAAVKVDIDLTKANESLGYEMFADWVTPKNDGEGFVVDEQAVKDYVTSLAVMYDTYNTSREFVTSKKKTIQVGGNGEVEDTYGFQMDVGETAKAIKAALETGKGGQVKAVWTVPANTRNEANGDIGNTYVEIDLTAQHMWYYRDGKLYVDTPIVSGYPNEERKTPTGLFRIWHKETDTRLQGQLASNGQTWDAPVDFWMPFTWTGVGIHDASWVSRFGPGINKTSGSHGCINTPLAAVSKMFEVMEYDTPVIVYYS